MDGLLLSLTNGPRKKSKYMQKAKKLEVVTSYPDGRSFTSETNLYDEKGNIVENIEYDEDGSIQNKIVAKFDNENRQLEEMIWNDGEIVSEHKKIIRKEDGSIDRTEIHYQDGSTAIQFTRKDSDHNTEEFIEEDEDGELESREFIKYDGSGNIILREVYDYQNKLVEAFEYTYGENGDLETRRQLDKRRKLVLINEYEYDENKNLIYRATSNRKGVLSDFLKMDYDENGNVIKQNISGKYSFVFEYDHEGRTVLEERYLADDQLEYQSRFEYDQDGRMTKEVNLEFTKEYKYEYF